MVPVPSHQLIEFLEWLWHRQIRIGERGLDWERLERLATEFLQSDGRSLFEGQTIRPSLEDFLRVFQNCPMISEPTVLEQMHHFAACGQCPSHMRERRSAFIGTLHPLLQGFVDHSKQTGFYEWVDRAFRGTRNVSMKMRHRLREFSVANSHFP